MDVIMIWTSILPKEINIKTLSLEECRNFKQFYDVLNQKVYSGSQNLDHQKGQNKI